MRRRRNGGERLYRYPHSETYRGVALLERAWGGHVNVSRLSGGFVGGYASMAAAKRAVDTMLDRQATT